MEEKETGYKCLLEGLDPRQNFIDCYQKQVKTEKEVEQSQIIEVKKCMFCNQNGCSGECRNKQALPSKIEMAKNLASAAKDHVKTGMAQAKDELQQQRLDICKGCEFYIPEQDRCGKCGCYLKSKSAWKSAKCPVGKWLILFCLLLI